MEEQNTTSNPDEKNESKQSKSKQNVKKEKGNTMSDYKAEFGKIIWPNREELSKKTVTVIVTSLLIGAVIFCMDTIYTTGYDFILGLLG